MPRAASRISASLGAVGQCDQTFAEKRSGMRAMDRPQLQALIRRVHQGHYAVVASMNCLARSVIDLDDIVQQITGDRAEHAE